MFKFLFKIITVALIASVLYLFYIQLTFSVAFVSDDSGYTASLIDKVDRLESIDDPKIILIGNSNVSFGFDSEMLENAFNMPVVNLGLHGSLNDDFHEQIAKKNISEGDLVIVAHTNYTDSTNDGSLLWNTLRNRFELYYTLFTKDFFKNISYSSQYFREKWIDYLLLGKGTSISYDPNDTVYSRYAFNEYGDIGKIRNENTFIFNEETNYPVQGLDESTIKRLNEFNDYCAKQGATLLISAFPAASFEGEIPDEKYDELTNLLKDNLNCDVISDFKEYKFPVDDFYDTYLHLTTEGAKKRTQLVIDDLNRYLESQ